MTVSRNFDQPNDPSAPSTDHLYNCEDDKDVVVFVQKTGEANPAARFPAHSFVLQQNHRFAELLANAPVVDNCRTIYIDNVTPDAFDKLLRFSYTSNAELENAEEALTMLDAACKYEEPNFILRCVEFLQQNLSLSNVLGIHTFLRCTDLVVTDEASGNCLNELKMSCHEIILSEAKTILNSEKFNQLPLDVLVEIVDDDRLGASELEVYQALFRWSTQACKRNGYKLVPERRREVLQDAIYKVRYFTMCYIEFESGPGKDDSPLTADEKSFITGYLTNTTNNNPAPSPWMHASSLYKKRSTPPAPQRVEPTPGEDTVYLVDQVPPRKGKRIIKRVRSALEKSLFTVMYWLD